MMPKEILDLIKRMLGEDTNINDIEAVTIRWDRVSPLDIELTLRR